jgi:sugar/nucleoside kinase (ribokinase family)
MAEFLHRLQASGIKTSIDVVSNSTVDFGKTVIPALKYCNFAIMNEIECCSVWNMDAYDPDGKLSYDHIKACMEKMVACGVKDKVIVHSKACSFSLNAETGEFTQVPSLQIPSEMIKGSVGAGDAFCSGCLYGIYHNFADRQLLEFASAAAACSLFAANSTDGMRTKAEILAVAEAYEMQPLL